MEIYCAECGCLVDRGIRVIACASRECCCLDLPMAEPMQGLAARTRRSFNTRDIDTMRSLLADDATWGEDPDGDSFCHDRDAIIGNLKRLLAEGLQATIVDTTTGPRGIAAHIQVEWPDPATARPDRIDFFQVYVVTGGLITEIHGHDTHGSAMAAISS
jgi:hypothetical protein